MAHQVAKIKLTKLLAKNHLTAWKENQLTLTIINYIEEMLMLLKGVI